MAQLVSLTDEDVAQLRGELTAGRPPMVWFTKAAVGVPAGGSAKVVAFGDASEGDFIQVRPTGSKDVLSFSPSELTRTRPPRRKAAPKPPARAPRSEPKPASEPVLPKAAPARPAPQAPDQPPEVRPTAAKPAPPRRAGRAAPPAEVTVTLSSTPDGDWRVEVVVGKKRTVRALPVPPADVARAARALPPQVSEAVDRALDAARRAQQTRVATLQAELEEAQRALTELG
ncbi:DUF6319 family protein [Actinophytocola sp.]|uniref:DUF6319 family protein n=1 Tax=Actinophytocola sp. TaxID=1872138 RepID=UPI002D7EF1A7|nr:DUF6319 family protein [Actinophytocola sp.]HET9139197.1 DUF6319 family protein [Actinophytocola sp.]